MTQKNTMKLKRRKLNSRENTISKISNEDSTKKQVSKKISELLKVILGEDL